MGHTYKRRKNEYTSRRTSGYLDGIDDKERRKQSRVKDEAKDRVLPESNIRMAKLSYEKGCRDKKSYRTLKRAYQVIMTIREKENSTLYAYKCDFCGQWHLTSRKSEDCVDVEHILKFWEKNEDRYRKKSVAFHEKLAALMKENGTDNQCLAEAVGVETSDVESWLDGSVYPFSKIGDVAEVLNVEMTELL